MYSLVKEKRQYKILQNIPLQCNELHCKLKFMYQKTHCREIFPTTQKQMRGGSRRRCLRYEIPTPRRHRRQKCAKFLTNFFNFQGYWLLF